MNAAVWSYLIATLAAIAWLSWRYTLAAESLRWPCVRGKVVRSWVELADSEYSYYMPRVEYTYRVGGTVLSSTTMSLSVERSMMRSRAESIAGLYKAGDLVDVWYDPKKPTRATLRRGGAGWLLAGLVIAGVVGPLLALAFTDTGRRVLGELGIHVE